MLCFISMCGPDADVPSANYRTPGWLQPSATAGAAANGDLVIERFPLTYDGYTYAHSHIAYVKGRPPAPVVIVHPNYAGLKQFDIDQAAFLAKVGYVGLAVDLYKVKPEYTFEDRGLQKRDLKGKPKEDIMKIMDHHFQGAFSAMNDLLLHPKHWRGLMGAYLEAAQRHAAVKAGLAGAIGYCLGGQCLLEQVRAGHHLQAVVSFHGLLQSRPCTPGVKLDPSSRMTDAEIAKAVDSAPNTYTKTCKVLIENGDLDDAVPEESIVEWKKEMDAQGVDWRFNNHARTPHGFALSPGIISTAYVEAADRRSTLSMLSLFAEVWPDFPQYPVETNACGTKLGQHIVTRSKL